MEVIMNCPICNSIMTEYKKYGTEKEYCPQCNEIWPLKRSNKQVEQRLSSSINPFFKGYNPKNHIYCKTNNHQFLDDRKRYKELLFSLDE